MSDYPAVEPGERQIGVGDPAGFGRLWTPHRMAYIAAGGLRDDQECPFCYIPTLDDETGLIIARGELSYVVLNLYPYNPGHLMIVPFRHVANYEELTGAEVDEIGRLTQRSIRALRAAGAPHGFNIGMNLGTAAGAGIAPHLHQHVVPRWAGDTNFMPVVGATRVLPELLADTRARLVAVWESAASA